MTSGKKERIVISCVTFETAMVVDPVAYYEASKVHLIHYVRDSNDPKHSVYSEFYEEVRSAIKEKRNIEPIEHIAKVYDFTAMLRTVLGILQSEVADGGDFKELYVNISSGTSEYVAAASIASMMVPGTVAFTVSTEAYTTTPEKIRDLYYEDGRPIGLSRKVRDPKAVPEYSVEMPDENLVRCLRELDCITASRESASAKNVIARLKDRDLWRYEQETPKRTDLAQKEAMYYQRRYVNVWIAKGWIAKDPVRKKYALTEEGKNVIATFYVDCGKK